MPFRRVDRRVYIVADLDRGQVARRAALRLVLVHGAVRADDRQDLGDMPLVPGMRPGIAVLAGGQLSSGYGIRNAVRAASISWGASPGPVRPLSAPPIARTGKVSLRVARFWFCAVVVSQAR
jgi:hypothetical protein